MAGGTLAAATRRRTRAVPATTAYALSVSTPPSPNPGAVPRPLADGRTDLLVREEPLLLDIAGQPLLTMRTPGRDEDLAVGFLLGEGVIGSVGEIAGMTFTAGDAAARRADTLLVTLNTPPDATVRGRLQRTHEIRSSCGACGLADPHEILDGTPPLLPGVPKLTRADLVALTARLQQHQPLFAATGGCHGALLLARAGTVLGHGEDVGRHNALDKLIGALAREGVAPDSGFVAVTSRASYEMVQKVAAFGAGLLVAVSAPTSFAVRMAHQANITLVGFARAGRLTFYTNH